MLDISPTAIREIKRLKQNSQLPGSSLRLSVKSGGCLGLYYDFNVDDFRATDNNSSVEEIAPGDRLVEVEGVTLVVSDESWKHIEHLQLDYSEDLMGGGFRFYNPQIKKTCGCGISFAESAKN